MLSSFGYVKNLPSRNSYIIQYSQLTSLEILNIKLLSNGFVIAFIKKSLFEITLSKFLAPTKMALWVSKQRGVHH